VTHGLLTVGCHFAPWIGCVEGMQHATSVAQKSESARLEEGAGAWGRRRQWLGRDSLDAFVNVEGDLARRCVHIPCLIEFVVFVVLFCCY
jgi:hypothetical protein